MLSDDLRGAGSVRFLRTEENVLAGPRHQTGVPLDVSRLQVTAELLALVFLPNFLRLRIPQSPVDHIRRPASQVLCDCVSLQPATQIGAPILPPVQSVLNCLRSKLCQRRPDRAGVAGSVTPPRCYRTAN